MFTADRRYLVFDRFVEDLFVMKHQGVQGLPLSRCREFSLRGQMGQKALHIFGSEIVGMGFPPK